MLQQVFSGELPPEALPQDPPMEVSLSWVTGFLHKHPALKLAAARVVEPDRAKFATKEQFDRLFDNLEALFDKYRYHPSMIANFDETFLVWGSNGWKVVTRASNKVGMVKEPLVHEHNTLCVTVFADGTALPALVILPLVNLPENIDPEDWKWFDWTGQKNGWIDKDIFDEYCTHVLIPNFLKRRAKLNGPDKRGLLVLDGHSSRINPELWKKFRAADIDVLVLPAHTSHVTQPLDLCVFSLFKRYLRPLPEYKDAETAPDKRYGLLKAAEHAFQMATCSRFIMKSFKRAGILPPNRMVVLGSDCVSKSPPPAKSSSTTPPKKKGNRINISNCIITDIIEEVEAQIEANKARSSSRKRTSFSATNDAPTSKRRKVTESADDESDDDVQMDVSSPSGFNLECSSCGRTSSHGTARWSSCPLCDEVYVCDRCPVGLNVHYQDEHPQQDPPKRRSNARSRNFSYTMDDDEEELD